MNARRSFEDLIDEAVAAPIDGWTFAWLDRRATEARPPWGYVSSLVPRIQAASSLLDLQTGGGEVLAEALGRADPRPASISATEPWPPNATIARRNLAPYDARVLDVEPARDLPFEAASFDLVIARHPVVIRWDEVVRVLAAGGTYFAQHVGPGSNRELTDFLMGPQNVSDARSSERAVADATQQGLRLVDVQTASLRVVFSDVGAVVWFLRKVPWTVPSFAVATYRDELRELHDLIESNGPFVSHAQRFLIELRKPGPDTA